ncbi:hypothetical protein AB0X64_01935 [Limosilactobacillus vaginalis]|uniref:hypothetical protein n=2 Tax=Lactobacillaceae TaxID=33958 RepID=UPI003F29DAE3
MITNSVNDIRDIYGFEIKDDQVVLPKIKFDKCVYERLEAFNSDEVAEEAADLGWTIYGVFQLVMGECDREDYDANPIGDASMFEPSKEFKHWLDMHYMWGPLMIMQALIYGNYELKEENRK